MPPSSSSTSSLFAGPTTAQCLATEVVDLSDTPRIFINVDKPPICWCTYCGLPFAHEKHRPLLEATPEHELSYPLGPKGDAAEVSETQQVTDEPLAQR
ncbi:unnamed protein product [Alternaria alternata]